MKIKWLWILALAASAFAQTPSQMRSTTVLPATCNPGTGNTPMDQIALITGSTATPNYCKTLNNWVSQVGTPVTLQTNGALNASQQVLNLIQGGNITLTADGSGGVTVATFANLATSGSPSSPQLARFVDANHVQGINVTGLGNVGVMQQSPTFTGIVTAPSIIVSGLGGFTASCIQVDINGLMSGTGVACGAGGGGTITGTGVAAQIAGWTSTSNLTAIPTTGTGNVVLSANPALTGTATAVNITASGVIKFADGTAAVPSLSFTNHPQLSEYVDLTGGQHQILQVVVSGAAGNQTIVLTVESPINPFSYHSTPTPDTFQIQSLPSSPTDLTTLNGNKYLVSSATATKPTATLTFTSTTAIAPGTYNVSQGFTQTYGPVFTGHEIMTSRIRTSTPNGATIGSMQMAVRDAWVARANFADDRAIDTPILRGSQVSPQQATGAIRMYGNGAQSTGSTNLSITNSTSAAWNAKQGDLIAIGAAIGDQVQQLYTVTANTTVIATGTTSLPISPGLVTNLTGGELISPYGVMAQLGDAWGAEVPGPLVGGLAGQPWQLSGVIQAGTSVTVPAGYDFSLYLRSDQSVGCQLSVARGSGTCLTGGSGSGNTTSTALTTNSLPVANGPNSIIDSPLTYNGTLFATTSKPFDVNSSAIVWDLINSGVSTGGGTVLNTPVKMAGGIATAVSTSDTTAAIIGICVGNCGTSGNAQIAVLGQALCVFDATSQVAGDYVQISATTNQRCHDAGATLPTTGRILGTVLDTAAGGSTSRVALTTQLNGSSGGGGSITGSGTTAQVSLFSGSTAITGSANLTFTSPELDIGSNGGATGILGVLGVTSGKVSIAAQAVAGTPTLILPNQGGTFVVSATTPLTVSATTGNISLNVPLLPVYGGSGLSSPAAHSIPITEGASNYALLTSPSVNGFYACGFNVVGSAAVDPSCALQGVPVNAKSGNYTLLFSDRASYIKESGTTTSTLTLPQITSNAASNFPFVAQNINSGTMTITANAADKIDNGSTGGSASVLAKFAAFVYQDSSSAPGNWWTVNFPTFAAFPVCGANCALGFSTSTGFLTTTNVFVGPSSSVSGNFVSFNGTTGLLGQDSGIAQGQVATSVSAITSGDVVCGAGTRTLADCNFLGTNVVRKDTTNTGAGAMTLDMSGSTSAAALRVPNIAGASSTTAGALSYDTTNKMPHMGANGVDNLIVLLPSSITPANNDCVKFSVVSSVITLNTAGGACGAGGTPALDAVTNLTTNKTFADGNFTLAFNSATTTGAQTAVSFGETTAATGSGDIEVGITTLNTSVATPLSITQGTGAANNDAPNVITLASGTGGASGASSNGSHGGDVSLALGAGSAGGATTGNGGKGGKFSLTAGNGATVSNAASNGGAGGDFLVTTGNGANGGASGLSGNGGNITFTMGTAGTIGTPGVTGQFNVTGTAPISVGTAGVAVGTLFSVSGIAGGATSGSATTAGIGSIISLTTGNGGSGSGGTNAIGGSGANMNFTTGTGGASGGTAINAKGGDFLFTPGGPGTGGSGTKGAPGQFQIAFNSVTGALTSPFVNITGTWNTSGVVDAAFLMNITTTAEGAASKLMDLQASSVSKFNVDYTGITTQAGNANAPAFVATGSTAGFADYPQGSTSAAVSPCNTATSICEQAPTSVTSYLLTKPGVAPNIASFKQTDGCGSSVCTESFRISPNVLIASGDFTTANNTSLQTITGLSVTMPVSKAGVASFHCSYTWSQATGTAAVAFGIQGATTAPTNLMANATSYSNTTAETTGTLTGLASTTATSVVSVAPSAITTKWKAEMDGVLEFPSNASPTVLNFMVSTATGADAVTVYRGSYCKVDYQ